MLVGPQQAHSAPVAAFPLLGGDYGCHSQALVTLSTISTLPYVMMHFVADDGEKIYLQVSGHGSPIIMLHGWTASHREWSPFLDPLTPQHRVYRWDARGHGGHRLTRDPVPTVQRMAR